MTRKEQIKEQLKELSKDTFDSVADYVTYCAGFYDGVAWADAEHPANIWKDAQGDDLPDYDREVVVLVQHVPEYSDSLRVSFGHRPNPKGYVVVNGEKLYARTFGNGWSLPNVRYWLDARLPYEKEEIKGNQGEISPNRIIGSNN